MLKSLRSKILLEIHLSKSGCVRVNKNPLEYENFKNLTPSSDNGHP